MPRVVMAPVSARCEAACRPAASPCSRSDTSLHAPLMVQLLPVVRLIASCMQPVFHPPCAAALGHGATRAARKKEPDVCTCKHARNQHTNQYGVCADFLLILGRDSLREPPMTIPPASRRMPSPVRPTAICRYG